ncbi:MAG: hypothetical protein IPK25_19360 [Saprospiraceae bacterium]|nr:hypothetical protein [Saprospiraceae bacterium]
MNKSLKFVLGIVAISLTAAVGYYFTKDSSSDNPETQEVITLKAGYLKHPGYLPLFCAKELGIWMVKNLQIELVPFESSPAITAAFNSGQV